MLEMMKTQQGLNQMIKKDPNPVDVAEYAVSSCLLDKSVFKLWVEEKPRLWHHITKK